MFGIIRPCKHRLSGRLHADWLAHLCGLCLALRDEHGQLARVVTNYDGLIISALVEAQTPRSDARRDAGPCPMRAMRGTSVALGGGAQLAAAVSLVLASAKVTDHVDDRDGAFGRKPVAAAARRVAARWAEQGERTGARVGFDTSVITDAVDRQAEIEHAVRLGDSPLLATEPAELATAAAFAQTAVLAGRPGNAAPLAEAGRLFGRAAHLLDAVEDRAADQAAGAWNPLLATGTGLADARRLCDDAVLGVELALREAEFADGALVHALLVHELRQAVRRSFGHDGQHGHQQPSEPPEPPDGEGNWLWTPKLTIPPKTRNLFFGCAAASYMCCTCQFCCRDPFPGPWSGKPRGVWCDGCDGCDCCGDCGCADCDCGCCDCNC